MVHSHRNALTVVPRRRRNGRAATLKMLPGQGSRPATWDNAAAVVWKLGGHKSPPGSSGRVRAGGGEAFLHVRRKRARVRTNHLLEHIVSKICRPTSAADNNPDHDSATILGAPRMQRSLGYVPVFAHGIDARTKTERSNRQTRPSLATRLNFLSGELEASSSYHQFYLSRIDRQMSAIATAIMASSPLALWAVASLARWTVRRLGTS